jgi:hypothetical protein
MKTLIPFLYILISFSCGPAQSDTANGIVPKNETANATVPQKEGVDIFLDTVSSISKRSTELTIKEVEGLLHEKYFKGIEFSVISEKGVTGKLNMYTVKLIGELPTALHRIYTFLDVKEKHLQFLLPIEFNQLYEIENRIMIGGIYTSREYEFYSIYELDSNILKRIFDTNKPEGQRIVTGYFKDEECVDYKPDRLLFQYNKQTNDLLFTGNAKRYCQPDRDRAKDDKVIEPIRLKLVFHYKKGTWELDKKKSHYFTW